MLFAPTPSPTLERRQLWNLPTEASSTPTCTPVTLASGGVLTINPTSTITFTTDHLYQPNCANPDSYFNSSYSTIDDYHDPFYGSTTVLIYVVATTTVIAWFLLTLLLIVPGNALHRGPSRSSGWLPGRTMAGVISAGSSTSNRGSRPWLQKAAALLVTIALTIASADTFKVGQEQYNEGYMNATLMRNAVVGSLAIRIFRVISDVFIWLAQVQTLIRLFPRRKEKLIIKWLGFLLILLDTVFSCLNSFYINSRDTPRANQDAIPALSYLFQLSISLLYGAWVSYYVATKRRYAFVSKVMPSITIVMILSIVAIIIPVGMFVADVSVPPVSGWGDFIRWVGAAAASVLVWEWVERIEFLEREEKKDGILGREVFDEDEMLVVPSSSKASSMGRGSEDGGGGKTAKDFIFALRKRAATLVPLVARTRPSNKAGLDSQQGSTDTDGGREELGLRSEDPATTNFVSIAPSPLMTPPSRADTNTPSTVYAVHYHTVAESALAPRASEDATRRSRDAIEPSSRQANHNTFTQLKFNTSKPSEGPVVPRSGRGPQPVWNIASQLFKRGKKSPPLEIKQAMSLNAEVPKQLAAQNHQQILLRKLGRFTAVLGGDSTDTTRSNPFEQPTIIPAPPRGHAWSPEIMRHSPVYHHQSATGGSAVGGANTTEVPPRANAWIGAAQDTQSSSVRPEGSRTEADADAALPKTPPTD